MSSSKKISVKQDVVDAMVQHAREDAPLETCAVLLGSNGEIDEYYEMENTDESEVHFTFEPEQQLKAMKTARNKGKDVVGIYHSHPAEDSRAYPSEEDQRHGWEEYVYFILTFNGDEPKINAFQFQDDSVIDIDYTIT